MKKIILFIFWLCSLNHLFAQKEAYKIYSKDGKTSSYSQMMETLSTSDIILFGELHNNPICHWLELEVTKDLYLKKQKGLLLGAEMFEADDQIILDEYLSGQIPHKHFISEGKMWPNYSTDYEPLIRFAKDSNLRFIATNIPRRYANYVARNGLDELKELSKTANKFMAPLPIKVDLDLSCYKMFVEMKMQHGSEMTSQKMAQAQASKDATMAHFILANYKKGDTFLHYNGSYHSDNFESIYWYLKKANKNLNITTIATVEQLNISTLNEDTKNTADFILVIPESMTKTY